MKNPNDTIEIRNGDFPICRTVPQPTAIAEIFHKIKILIKKIHIYAAIPHASLLTSPTDSNLSANERTNRGSYIFLIKKRKTSSDKTKTYIANSTSEPLHKEIFTTKTFLHTVSDIFICGLFNENLNQTIN